MGGRRRLTIAQCWVLCWALCGALCAALCLPVGLAPPASAGAPRTASPTADPDLSAGPDRALKGSRGAAFFTGDSLTYDTWHWGGLPFEAELRGWQVSGARARGGLRAHELAAMWPQFADDLPGVVLIAIGANDVIHGTPPDEFRRSVLRMIRLSPRRKIVLVSIFVRTDPLVAGREQDLNAALRGIARGRDRVSYADWGRVVERHPDWPLPSDVFRIHLTQEGLKGRAQFYLDAIDRASGR